MIKQPVYVKKSGESGVKFVSVDYSAGFSGPEEITIQIGRNEYTLPAEGGEIYPYAEGEGFRIWSDTGNAVIDNIWVSGEVLEIQVRGTSPW